MSETSAHDEARSTFAQKAAWVLYDVGNSGFGMIVAGVMFNIFFNRHLTPVHLLDGESKHALMIGSKVIPADGVFAIMTAITAVMVTFAAPVLGAIADVKGWTKRLLVIHATCGSVVSLLTATLKSGDWFFGAILFILAGYFFAGSLAFYNSFLPRLAPPAKQGRLSGAGFAAGYVGGAIALIIASKVIAPAFDSTAIGIAFGGVWWFLFSIPAFILLPSIRPVGIPFSHSNMVIGALKRIGMTFKSIRKYRMLFMFLGAYLLYQNGIDTIINISPAYASQVLTGASDSTVQWIFLLVQFVAFPGALLCGYLADKVGNRPVIITTLLIWCVVVSLIPLTTSVAWFTAAACVIGLVLGGVQSSSRALMSHLAPPEIRNEAFGFFSVSGKAISIFGPLAYAAIASVFGSRLGVLAVLPFMIAGLLVLLKVKDRPAESTKPLAA